MTLVIVMNLAGKIVLSFETRAVEAAIFHVKSISKRPTKKL